MRFLTITAIAAICHEANRRLCEEQGDDSQVEWIDAPDWQKESEIKGVTGIFDGSIKTPEDSHNSWLAEKKATGWKYGPVKDPEKKEHPCFVPYDELPPAQQAKDHLFRSIVLALANFSIDGTSPDLETPATLRADERKKVCAEAEAEVQRLRNEGENDLRSVIHIIRSLRNGPLPVVNS